MLFLSQHDPPLPKKSLRICENLMVAFFESGWVWTNLNPPVTPPLVWRVGLSSLRKKKGCCWTRSQRHSSCLLSICIRSLRVWVSQNVCWCFIVVVSIWCIVFYIFSSFANRPLLFRCIYVSTSFQHRIDRTCVIHSNSNDEAIDQNLILLCDHNSWKSLLEMAWIKQFTPLLDLWSQETAEIIIPPVFYHQKCLLLFMSKEQSTVLSNSEAEISGTASSTLDCKMNYQYNEADECCLFCGKRRKIKLAFGKKNPWVHVDRCTLLKWSEETLR